MVYSRTARTPDNNQFGLFPLAVTAVQKLSEHFVRISLAGPALHHAADEISDGTGDVLDAYIKLMVAPPSSSTGLVELALDENWRARYMGAEPEERGWIRTYTVRDSRLIPEESVPEIGADFQPFAAADTALMNRELPAGLVPEIDIDFVLHTDADGVMGPGAAWAAGAQVGDRTSILAPMRGNLLWASWNPCAATRILVLADETAVPAALSVARDIAPGVSADILLEVPSEADVWDSTKCNLGAGYSELHPEIRFHWLPRGCNGSSVIRGEELYRRLRQILDVPLPEMMLTREKVSDTEIVWGLAASTDDLYIFIAGESSVIKTLRRICVNDAGIDKSQISFMGYWKKGKAEG